VVVALGEEGEGGGVVFAEVLGGDGGEV